MIGFVFKPRRRVAGVLRVAEHYSAKLRMPWEARVQIIALNTSDKRVAQDALNQIVRERHQERQGLLPSKTVRDAAERPIAELLDLFLADLLAKGRSDKTLKKYRSILPLICERCGWDKLPDVTARSFCEWRIKSGLGPKTLNDYLGAASGFAHWLQRQGMLRDNPLSLVDRVDTRCINPFRRALSVDEVGRLLKVAPHFRAVVYLVALNTGLRRNELNSLRWCSVILDTPQPFVRVSASMSKNKKEACLFLRPEVVTALRSIKEKKAKPADYVFRYRVPRITTLWRDLAAAGVPEVDEQGRRADFHSLRVTFGTNLSASGAHPRVAMEMMRHSDLKLTMKIYTDVAQLPVAQALAALPAFAVSGGSDTGDGVGARAVGPSADCGMSRGFERSGPASLGGERIPRSSIEGVANGATREGLRPDRSAVEDVAHKNAHTSTQKDTQTGVREGLGVASGGTSGQTGIILKTG